MGQQICVQEKIDKKNQKVKSQQTQQQQVNYKWVEGMALLDIHQLKCQNALTEILNETNLIPALLKSFNRIQTEKCLQVFRKVDEQRIKIVKCEIIKTQFPYIATFTMRINIPKKFEIFVESPTEDKYDIFDWQKKYGEINVITGFWQGENYEQNIQKQYQDSKLNIKQIQKSQQQQQDKTLNQVITSAGSDEQQTDIDYNYKEPIKKNYNQDDKIKEQNKYEDLSTNDEQTFNQFNNQSIKSEKPLCHSELLNMSQDQHQISILKKFEEQQQKKPENQKQQVKSLEISQEYFAENYRKILKISEGCFGGVFLYFDKKKKKLLAVKILKNVENIYGDIEQEDDLDLESQYEEEERRVLRAIRRIDLPPQERFNDKQDEGIKGLNRNIVREILITQNREQNSKINCLEGVVFIKQQRKFLLIFEYFGGCEYGQEKPTCDLFRYLDLNKQKIFLKMSKTERFNFIYNVMEQIIDGVKNLYEENNLLYSEQDKQTFLEKKKKKLQNPQILIRDLNQANILIRRKFSEIPNKSEFDIMLIDFGMAKNCQNKNTCNITNNSNLQNHFSNGSNVLNTSGQRRKSDCSDNSNPTLLRIGQQVSIAIQACHPGRSPKYLFDEYQPYNQKDDIFGLSALFYTLHKQLDVKMEPQAQKFLEYISGMDIKRYDQYNYVLTNYFSEQCFDNAKKLFKNGLQSALEDQKKVPFFDDMMQQFKILKKQQCNQGKNSGSAQ